MSSTLIEPTDSWIYKGLYFLKYSTLDSTNKQVAHLLEHKALGGPSVIIAEDQSEGRGQMRTKWHSTPGNSLLFSIFFKHKALNIQDQFMFNKAVSVALIQTTLAFNKELKIKWPNDLYFNNKKLAGVLIENQIGQSNIKTSIVGIGINISEQNFPVDLPNPISLQDITPNSISLQDIESELPYAIVQKTEVLLKKPEECDRLYNQYLFGREELLQFTDDGGSFEGTIKGVNENGQLQVEADHHIKSYNFKEVKYLL